MKLLLHCCCGPCAAGSVPQYQAAGYEPFGYFFNPNIHPSQEHKLRRQSFVKLMEEWGLPYLALKDYPLEEWLAHVAGAPAERCAYCYESRLEAAAAYAAANGFDHFSTTLLISPYQKHELIREIGARTGEKHGVDFVYLDLRPGFREGQERAREMGLYMQKYCGCIYSEKERYVRKKKAPKEAGK